MSNLSITCKLFLCCILLSAIVTACRKNDSATTQNYETPGKVVDTQTSSTTDSLLLDINYETGTLNSGITNLNTTDATAPDASYIVSPGRTGNYAVAHKVNLADSGYFSDNHFRSESATANVTEGKHWRGDHRRYEFSLLLKDWTPYSNGMSQTGDIIFQGKLGGGGNPAWYFMTKRNTIAFRMPNDNLQVTIVGDYRTYINQWMDFRVEVLWADTPTGYYKVYSRLPGQTNYSLIWQISNFKTFNPDNPNAISGYLKWGLYRAGSSLANGDVQTRIIYHDDIRIYELP